MNAAAPRLIVHVVHRFAVGGLENGLVNLLNQLPADSWQHLVVSLTEIDKKFVQRVKRDDVKYLALHKGSGHAVPLYPRLFKLFRKLRPAIVHTRNLAALEACVPAWAARIPARVHGEHGREVDDLDGANVRKQWVRRAFRPFVTRYVALSPELERYLDERVGVPAHRIQQIYNGVDTARFCPLPSGRAPIKGCPFQDSALWLVGTVGRMDVVKDQTNLARAFVHALRLRPEARRRMRLIMVGEGRLKGPVESILQEGGARDLVWLPGERADVPRLLQGIDCFVLPSLAEGVSNTVLEAMASGLPVVATLVGANGELVEDGVTGRLVAAGNSEALARDIVAYFDDPAMAKRHGHAGRHRAEQNFSLELMVEHYHRLYTDLVRSRAPRERKARATMPDRRTPG